MIIYKKCEFLIIILVMLSINYSCSSNKKALQVKSVYELIIDDIKKDNSFKEFIKKYENNCQGLRVSRYEYHICEFRDFSGDEIKSKDLVRLRSQLCENYDIYEDHNYLKKNLNQYSEKGEKCFQIYFSEKLINKIVVKIRAIETLKNFGYDTLNYIYEVNNGNVKQVDSYGFKVN